MNTADHEPTNCVVVRIEGRVQGVWFRGWTFEEATRRGLQGWVRNRRDGSVEAVFAGPAAAVNDMVRACWRGPSAARVTAVNVASAPWPESPGFSLRPTE